MNAFRSFNVDRAKITTIATEICRRLGVAHYEVCLQFVSPRAMKTLNKKFRKKDNSTDVLSFPQYEFKRPLKVQASPPASIPVLNPLPLGDVVISIADAANNAREAGQSLDREVCFLVIHGILHLVGHDHMKAAEKKRMFAEQAKLMRVFGGSKSKAAAWTGCAAPTRRKSKTVKKTKTSKTRKRRA
jgi:probable rRNA maturation factor